MLTKDEAIKKLLTQIDKMDWLGPQHNGDHDDEGEALFYCWQKDTKVLMDRIGFKSKIRSDEFLSVFGEEFNYHSDVNRLLPRAKGILCSFLNEIREFYPGDINNQTSGVSVSKLRERLGFLKDQDIKKIVQRDLREIEIAIQNGQTKTALLLCGSILEAVMIDVLMRNEVIASSIFIGKLRKKGGFPDKASLDDLLFIAIDEDLLGNGSSLFSDTAKGFFGTVKDHRDLIHPHRELRSKLTVDSETAQGMAHLLLLVIRELDGASNRQVLKLYEER